MVNKGRGDAILSCCGLELTEAVEDYLKAVFQLATEDPTGNGRATTSAVAARLGVSAPSASAMLKRLGAHQLLVRSPETLSLTPHGERHALQVVRRHRLLETFLAEVLEVPWDEVHAEAEILEHVVSDRLEARIDAVLGHPGRDPHGDPIPPRDGRHSEDWAEPLDAAPAGTAFTVERVSDRDSAALRYLADLDIRPGVTLRVEDQDPFGGPLWVWVDEARHALGRDLTPLVHGRPDARQSS